jgi:hypothetical protein
MIERIFPTRAIDESLNPFCRGAQERSLRVTLHSSSFAGASASEVEALDAVSQLAHLPEIEALLTQPGEFPCLEIGVPTDDRFYIPVTVRKDDMTIESGVKFPDQWLAVAADLAGQDNPEHPEVQSMFEDIIVARAHFELGQDVLVTLSPNLLGHRFHSPIREVNPRTPAEAAKIVGLYLRSRDNHTYYASRIGRRGFDRGLYYLVLTRHRLPNMWRYFSACIQASEIRDDDILFLGQSILFRCIRAIEARDAIGVQFYRPQDNNTRDAIMYHFDYLTLVLSGVFDAQARVAHRAYQIDRLPERQASFRRRKFRNELRNNGATDLFSIASDQHFRDVMTLLYEPRNTIHGAGLPTVGAQLEDEPEASFVSILPQYQNGLWEAAERCGSTEHWGLIRLHKMLFEPYTYSDALVEASLQLIDSIAGATDVTRFFPAGYPIPPLPDGPPEESPFTKAQRRRLEILG